MGFRCGIVGLPNVGKSSLFNVLTNAGIGAENYPFCTIDPNVGVVPVPDPRLQRIADIVKPARVIPAHMEFVDIAGLVAGASKGEGLGNQFLAHIREMQALAHVVRCFEDDNVTHVHGRIDPPGDIETIRIELALADLATVERALERAGRQAKSGDAQALQAVGVYERLSGCLNEGRPLRGLELSEAQRPYAEALNLLSMKPVLFVANVDERGLHGNSYAAAVSEIAAAEGARTVVICAALESELAALGDADRAEFLVDLGLEEPGLNRLIRAGYELLDLQTFFTAGPKECRAWTIRAGTKAPQAAAVIHTDFERGFIRAEVIAFEDFVAFGGEQGAKEQGRWRLEGRDYPVRDGDVVHFRFNV